MDVCSNGTNALLPRFNTIFFHPLSEGVGAFTRLWEGGNNWLVIPVSLVKRPILHSVACRAECTLVVPFWPSSPFWSSIFDRDGQYQCYVTDVLEFHDTADVLTSPDSNCVFHPFKFRGSILAIKIDARFV